MVTSIIYEYQEAETSHEISFSTDGQKNMINATEMAKPFGKRPIDWLRLPSTISFIKTLTEVRKSHNGDYEPIKTIKGGKNGGGGTWFHEDVALEFARWLSPKFAIWCNDRIKELLKKGYVYLVTAKPYELHEHLNHQVQRENSKAIATKNYGLDKNQNRIINHYRNITHKLVGIYPRQIKSWARENNIPLTVINSGSREILRYISSSATACMSLIENIIASNPEMTSENVDELLIYVEKLEPFFAKMIEIGHYDYNELKKIRKYKKMKLNEK